ncbi:MAG: carboxylate-amine ligase [Bacteroidetes bacterium]|nr:carboxylate-amine ligase [Bacteroidota bacterium]
MYDNNTCNLNFKELQQQFADQYRQVFNDKMAHKTIVILPGISLDVDILSKLTGVLHYEERMLCMLMLLRFPNTHVVYMTSIPIDPVIIDYYLHLLPGITGYHARKRLTLLSCFDASRKSLTEKILERPRLIEQIRKCIPDKRFAHLSAFNVTNAEKELAMLLGIPLYGCDPDLLLLGTKSSCRKIFRECGIALPDGFEDLNTEDDIIDALTALKKKNPNLEKAVIKINDGFSGEGNSMFSFRGAPNDDELHEWVKVQLPQRIKIIAADVSYRTYLEKFNALGGIVEVFIDGESKCSPSVQCRINPLGVIDIISTHDQILGGESGQVFLGAIFPANHEYAHELGVIGKKISEYLKQAGVLGRFAIDFISIKKGDQWIHYAIEINVRKGGTTHPYLMLQFLTNGHYDADKGKYFTANGQTRYYVCSDNFQSPVYQGLTPYDLIDIATCSELIYNGTSQEGVMFHMISALSQYGKMGLVCIGSSLDRAKEFYQKAENVFNNHEKLR